MASPDRMAKGSSNGGAPATTARIRNHIRQRQSSGQILTSILRYDFLKFVFLSSELETQTENKIIFK
jgi:hypothetical protein